MSPCFRRTVLQQGFAELLCGTSGNVSNQSFGLQQQLSQLFPGFRKKPSRPHKSLRFHSIECTAEPRDDRIAG